MEILTPAGAVTAARSPNLADIIDAREFAERLGYNAFDTKAAMPPEFAGLRVLTEGFAEGLANARCEHAQVQAGML